MDDKHKEPAPQAGLFAFFHMLSRYYKHEKELHIAYHHLFRLLHWILAAAMLVLIYSGLGIHSIARPEWSLIGRYPHDFLGGRIIIWHLAAAVFFLPAALLASFLFFRRIRNIPGWSSRRFASIALLAGSILAPVSALGLIYTGIPSWLYHVSRLTHFISGLLLVPLGLLMHLYLALTKHRLLLVPAFTLVRQPRWGTALVYLGTVVLAFLLVGQMAAVKTGPRRLAAKKIPNVPRDWEAVKKLAWNMGETLRFTLTNGSGFYKGSTEVAMTAFYDDSDIYFKIVWADPRENREYWPWVKTEEGWERLKSDSKDESMFYEDKFSMLFPIERDRLFESYGCAAQCHTSSKFRYGYKAAYKMVDVWHWKAVRTDPMGYADDQYWLGHDLSKKNVGRFNDPDEGGGFTVNESTDGKTPLYLPGGRGATLPGMGAMLMSKAAPYTREAADRLPEGMRIRGILVAPVKGDRGDVACFSQHRRGKWTLFLRRKLDTGSKYDLAFAPGRSYPFSCAAFDHASVRHAYNYQVYRLALEKPPRPEPPPGTGRHRSRRPAPPEHLQGDDQ